MRDNVSGTPTNNPLNIEPAKDEFLKLAARGNLIPVTRRILADFETPLSAYHKIRGQGESFLFESVEGGEHVGRYSFVGCNPRAVIRQSGRQVEVIENGKVTEIFTVQPAPSTSPVAAVHDRRPDDPQPVPDGLAVVEQIMRRFRAVSRPGLPRFTGGAVGFIGVSVGCLQAAYNEKENRVMFGAILLDTIKFLSRLQTDKHGSIT